MKNNFTHYFKAMIIAAFLCVNYIPINAQQMAYTPYEELPSIQKILKPTYSESMPDWGKMLYNYPVNFFEINNAYSKWEKENPGEKNSLSRYFKLWRQAINPYVTANGTILMPNVNDLTENLKKVQSPNNQIKKAPAVGNTSNWTFWGPKQTFWLNDTGASFVQKPAPWQANVYTMDVTEANPNVIYIGTETGFVNKSIDKGQTWNISGQKYVFGGSIKTIAIHPVNPDTTYVAAGSTVHRTLNGGTTWSRTGAAFDAEKLLIDPKNPSKLLAAGYSGFYVSTNRSAAWSQKLTSKCWDVEFKPNSSDTVYVVTETAANFIKIQQSIDGGLTFTDISSFPTDVKQDDGALLAVTPKNPNVLWVGVLGVNTAVTPNTKVPYIYKGTLSNGVWSWAKIATGSSTQLPVNNGQGFFDFVLEVSPVNENIVFFGTTTLYKSTNGGASFSIVGGYGGNFSIHPDIQSMRMLKNGETWVTTDGGVTLTTDNFTSTSNYFPLVNGLIGSNMWGFDQGWNEDLIVGGRYHNGNTAIADFYGDKALRLGGGESATGWIVLGKSRAVAFDDIYSGNGRILPATATGMISGSFTFSKHPNMDEFGGLRSNILTHPNYSGTLYVAKDSTLWISKDYGANYELLYKFTNGKIRYIANSTSNPNVIYADIVGGGFYKTIDGGTNWTKTTSSGAPSWNGKMHFAISPYNSEVLYACYQIGTWDKYNNEVYRSLNGGTSWSLWSSFGKSVKSIVIQPTTAGKDLVYAITTSLNTTAATVYFRKDGDAAWTDFGTNFPASMNIQACAPFFRDSKLRAAGNGGVWESPLAEPDFTPILVPWVSKKVYSCTLDTVSFDDHSMVNHQGATWNWEFTPAPSYISNANSRNPKAVFDYPGKYTVKMTITKGGVVYEKTIVDMFEIGSCPTVSDCSNPGDVPKSNWKLIQASSFYPSNEPAKAFDGNTTSIWHSSYGSTPEENATYPHFLSIDLGRKYNLSKMTYVPRTDGGSNGNIKGFQLYISNDKLNWGTPVITGNMTNTSGPSVITFPNTTGQYVKFVATSEIQGRPWASCAELSFTGCFGTTGISEIEKEFNVKAFPIPTNSILRMSLPINDAVSTNYAIYNSIGKQIVNGTANTQNGEICIDVTNLNSGYYFVNITDKTGITYKAKFVKK